MGILKNIAGMGDMTEQIIATDLLISAKSGIKNYAVAITEAVTPEVNEVLYRHLQDAIKAHEKISKYMMDKGYYCVNDPQKQVILDIENADTVLNIQ